MIKFLFELHCKQLLEHWFNNINIEIFVNKKIYFLANVWTWEVLAWANRDTCIGCGIEVQIIWTT